MTRVRLEQLSLRHHLRRTATSPARSSITAHGYASPARLVLHQARFDLRSFSRNQQARFTTLALPIVLLVAFVSVGGGNKTFVQDGRSITTAVFFVPGLIALAVISASFSNLLTDLVAQRDSGVLKRRRATPVPAYALIGGRTLTATAISLATAALLLIAGGNIYDVAIPNHALPAVAVTIVLGSITFAALAYALAPSIHSSTAIQPVITLILLPLYAISGVLLPNSKNPDWLNQVAGALPLQHLAHALHHAFDPTTHGLGLSPIDLAVLAAWALAALTLAAARFTWLPRAKAAT
jgi:ABC-2 type transport system permease protein